MRQLLPVPIRVKKPFLLSTVTPRRLRGIQQLRSWHWLPGADLCLLLPGQVKWHPSLCLQKVWVRFWLPAARLLPAALSATGPASLCQGPWNKGSAAVSEKSSQFSRQSNTQECRPRHRGNTAWLVGRKHVHKHCPFTAWAATGDFFSCVYLSHHSVNSLRARTLLTA